MISARSSVSTWGVWYQEWPQFAHLSERPFRPKSSDGISKWAVQFGQVIRIPYSHSLAPQFQSSHDPAADPVRTLELKRR
jgi:hypothetical protein